MKTDKGLTLIELMVTLAVLAVILAIGAPQLGNLGSGNKVTTVVNKLNGDLAYARSEAATRNRTITVTSNNGVDWGNGWQIFDDITVLRSADSVPNQITLTGTVGTFAYSADGSQSAGNLSFQVCGPTLSGKPSKEISINATGRAHLIDGPNCP
jgi:type IV fimbrial biogenesis protein FimT